MADNKNNPLLGCHSERFPSSWAGVSQPELPKNTPIDLTDEDDDDELPRWNTTKRMVSNAGRKRPSGSIPPVPAVSGQQSLPMPAQRPLPSSQTLQGMLQAPRPAGPILPARKPGAPAQQSPFGGLHGGPRLLEPRHQTPLSLLKASPSSGTPRPAHVVVVGEKPWAAPNQASAEKARVSSGQHSMINVDARSAPKGPVPQGVPSMHPRAAPWASGQPLPGRDRLVVSAPSPALQPMAALSRPQVLPQSMPLKAPQAAGRASVTPTREERTPAPFLPGKGGAWHTMKIPIVCNGNRGYYLVHSSTCICCCVACNERAKRADLPCIQISPTEFERHSGMSATKKWKTTLRVERPGERSISLGAHLEVNGLGTGIRSPGDGNPESQPAASAAAPAALAPKQLEPKKLEPVLQERFPAVPPQAPASAPLAVPNAAPGAIARAPEVKAEALVHPGVSVPTSADAAKPQEFTRGPRTRGGHKRSHSHGRLKPMGDTKGDLPAEGGEGDAKDAGAKPMSAVDKATRAKWLKGGRRNMKPQIRQGPEYQAAIPPKAEVKTRPTGDPSAEDRLRGGTLIPSAEAVLASVAGPEKAAADALPMDAKMDPNESIGKQILLQRGQRQRKKPQWLDNTIDPHLPDKKWGLPNSRQDLEYEGSMPLESDTGSGAAAGAPKRRRRSQHPQSHFQYQDSDRLPVPEYYMYGDDEETRPPVPKRMRSVAGDWPTTMQLESPSPQAMNSRPESSGLPQLLTHQAHQDGQILHVTVSHHGRNYVGALVLESKWGGSEAPLAAPKGLAPELLPAPRSLAAESLSAGRWQEEPGLAGSAAPSSSTPHAGEQNLIDVPIGQVKLPRQLPAEEGVQEVQSLRAKEKQPAGPKPKGEERRAAAAEEYHRLLQEGAPPGTKCVLCHQEQHADAGEYLLAQRQLTRTPEGVTNRALGPLLLVRVSAISNAWVHMQCALWSGEVWVSESGGLEKVDEAVRRGRMIKCKACNRKGATLGCHIRSCRHSFHMVCARATKCRLHEDGRLTCPTHLSLVSGEPLPRSWSKPIANGFAPSERLPTQGNQRQSMLDSAPRQRHPDLDEDPAQP